MEFYMSDLFHDFLCEEDHKDITRIKNNAIVIKVLPYRNFAVF